MRKIWQKKLLEQTIVYSGVFFLFLFLIISIINFSTHSVKILKAPWKEIGSYYLFQGLFYLDILLPLSFMLAMAKILSQMNIHKEITSLFVAGLSKKNFFYPLLFLATIFSGISIVNQEYLIPQSAPFLYRFQKKIFFHKFQEKKRQIQSLILEDETRLVFAHFNFEEKFLQDVFWIVNFNEIWHMEKLYMNPHRAIFATRYLRDANRILQRQHSFPFKKFNQIPLHEKDLLKNYLPLHSRSLSFLIFLQKISSAEEVAKATSLGYGKIVFSLSFYWIVLFLGPLCIQFSRNFSPVKIFGICILLFLCFYALINTLCILSENLVISPFIACFLPFLLLVAYSLKRYIQLD